MASQPFGSLQQHGRANGPIRGVVGSLEPPNSEDADAANILEEWDRARAAQGASTRFRNVDAEHSPGAGEALRHSAGKLLCLND